MLYGSKRFDLNGNDAWEAELGKCGSPAITQTRTKIFWLVKVTIGFESR